MSDERRTHTDVMSLPRLIGWLALKPADATYCYGDGGRCLLHQYFTEQGRKVHGVGGETIRITKDDPMERTTLPDSFQLVACREPHTFGDALERAREWK